MSLQVEAWDLFVHDHRVKGYIALNEGLSKIDNYTEAAIMLWKKVLKHPKGIAEWKSRADHINENRKILQTKTNKKPRLVSTANRDGTYTVDFFEADSWVRCSVGPARIIYNGDGQILKVFMKNKSN